MFNSEMPAPAKDSSNFFQRRPWNEDIGGSGRACAARLPPKEQVSANRYGNRLIMDIVEFIDPATAKK